MPVTVSYPGLYVEELTSNAHTITAAPTSVAVFVGYTHPFKTRNFDIAVQIFSAADYEREFGPPYSVDFLTDHVNQAVNQFFLNGGASAYVVGLSPSYHDIAGVAPSVTVQSMPPTLTFSGIIFTAREPTDATHPMTIQINNLQDGNTRADIIVAYGTRVVETYRRVALDPAAPDYIEKRIGTTSRPISSLSSLITVAPDPAAAGATPAMPYGTTFTPTPTSLPVGYSARAGTFTTFNTADFAPVFAQDSSLDKVSIFNLLIIPGVADFSVLSDGLAFCEQKRAFMILDPPLQAAADPTSALVSGGSIAVIVDSGVVPKSTNGALYFPYLRSHDLVTNDPIELPPSGFVAGVFAREDNNRGVWKAPAGLETIIHNTTGVVARGRMTDLRQGTLNPKGVNCLRDFPGIGTVVFGARTLVTENPSFQQHRYVPVRRMTLFLEQSLVSSLGWVVFEPNDVPLWVAIRTTIENFMLGLFHQGAFQGTKPSDAFQVKCDSSTTTQDDIDNGIVNIIVAFAPLKPAEFVIIKIAQLAGQVQA